MTQQLQMVLEAARALPPLEQIELIQELSQFLQENYPFAVNAATFWSPRSLAEIADAHPVPEVKDILTLAVDFWPKGESPDDFIAFLTERRQIEIKTILP